MSTAIVRGAGPRDGFPDYIVRSLSRNELGVFSGLVERHFKVGGSNQRIDPVWLLPGSAPRPWTIPCIDAQANIQDAMCIVAYRYQGGGDTPPTEADVTYELETTMADKPIQTHPKFESLSEIYEWDEHNIKRQTYTGFAQNPENLVLATNGYNALSRTKRPKAATTLFGVESFFSVSVVFVKKYAVPSSRMPGNLLSGIGTIVPKPAGVGQFNLPPASEKRNWLKMAPRLSKKGDLTQIEERTALSHVDGWKKAVYDAGQLDEQNGDPSSGLTTGNLQ